MALQNIAPPSRTREAKYKYSDEEVAEAFAMLFEQEGSPADGPFETAGQARSAANALVVRMEGTEAERGKQVGSRVWEQEPGQWYFALKVGRKKGGGRPAGSTNGPTPDAEPEPEPRRKSRK